MPVLFMLSTQSSYRSNAYRLSLFVIVALAGTVPSSAATNVAGGNGDLGNVTLAHHGEEYVLANSNVTAVVMGPNATVTSLKYHRTECVIQNGNHDAIYWSMDGGKDYQDPGHANCTSRRWPTSAVR